MISLLNRRNAFRAISILLIAACLTGKINAQALRWTEADRQYLLENLSRTRQAIIDETKGLTAAQWTFKESPDRWSIAGVIEHLAAWELIYARETDLSMRQPPDSSVKAKPDSTYLAFLAEEQPHTTKTYTQPQMRGNGEDHLKEFLYLRDLAAKFVTETRQDLRLYYIHAGRPNAHQLYLNLFGHCDRHLRQIRKIKQHALYPGKKSTNKADR